MIAGAGAKILGTLIVMLQGQGRDLLQIIAVDSHACSRFTVGSVTAHY